MTCNDDERSLLHGQRNRSAVCFRVCLIQQFHALEIFLANLHDDGQQLIHTPIFSDSKKCFCKETVNFFVGIAQYHGMVRIGSHAAHTEKDQRLEAANILPGIPQQRHVVIIVATAARCAAGAIGNQPFFFGVYPVNHFPYRFFVKVHIGDSGKQPFHHQPPGIRCCLRTAVR